MAEANDKTEEVAGNAARAEGSSKRGLSKAREGYVTSNKMDKSIVVSVSAKVKHPTYGKYVTRTKKYVAHDAKNECQIGDKVAIIETRPLSKTKRWRLQQIFKRAV